MLANVASNAYTPFSIACESMKLNSPDEAHFEEKVLKVSDTEQYYIF